MIISCKSAIFSNVMAVYIEFGRKKKDAAGKEWTPIEFAFFWRTVLWEDVKIMFYEGIFVHRLSSD